ncbi:MAG: LamG domain-containing protein [Planctomycetota bacterium]
MKSLVSISLACPLFAFSMLTRVAPAQWTGEWPMDSVGGVTAVDVSGNANDGALINFGASPWGPGQIGNALSFDGVDDYVRPASEASIYAGLGAPYSICYWVKAPAQQNRFVYAEGAIASQAIFIFGSGQFLPDSDKFRVYLRNDQGDEPLIGVSNAVVYDDTWHHVAFVDVAGDVTLYIDGVVDTGNIAYDPMRMPGMPGHGTFSMNTASMGALRRGTVCCQMDGELDDVRLYQFALTPSDVALAIAGVPLLPTSASVGNYGVGCGAGPMSLAATGSAVLGGPGLDLQAQAGQPGALAVLACGLGPVLPVDLGPAGYPGCTFYPQNVATALLGAVDAAGNAPSLLFAIPNTPALAQTQLNCQAVALVGATLEFTDVVEALVGF